MVIERADEHGSALQRLLSVNGHDVVLTDEGLDGWVRLTEDHYDLMVLDLQVVESNPLDFCRRAKERKPFMPQLLLSSEGEAPEVIRALEAGASSYCVKPVNPFELAARAEALMRLKNDLEWNEKILRFGDNLVDLQTYHVFRNGRCLDISGVVLDLLKYFIKHQGEMVTRNDLLRDVWGCQVNNVTRTVDMHVSKLRRKLERDPRNPRHLVTVQGKGYRFIP
ncbi:MAG: response regulator transcription factor [Acidobacteria bacterium]|nr:response regulator transcription factor [Acidobacteriota bacterium]